ncbi:MAG TPA: hypothetical protein VKS43_14630 [Burkholderiales bacterium]|nr:hypothetical protein [Burkholderiales bacterium]
MLRRLALLTILGAVSACDAPPPPATRPAAKVEEAAPALSQRQVYELSEQCATRSRDQFRRDWKNGAVSTPQGRMSADFIDHYNAKLNTCFYLLTVRHSTDNGDQGGASTDAVSIKLFDIGDGEQYGEYSGPAVAGSPPTSLPKTCSIEAMYCASRREWDVLLQPYMED